MSRKVRSCELESIDLSEECYLEMSTFLETFQITAIEAQIVYEVANYRQPHIDLNTLSKTIPKEFKRVETEATVKTLINSGVLQPYESKKEVLCVACTGLGRDIAYLIRDRCYSQKLRYFDLLNQKYGKGNYLLCFDPQGFKVGEKRSARGPSGEKILMIVTKKSRSDKIFRQTKDGKPVYEIKLSAEVLSCPQCGGKILVEFCYNPTSCYREFLPVRCDNCNFEFMLRHALDKFYY